MDVYQNLSDGTQIRVRPGAMPTLQFEDGAGRDFSLNITGTPEQLWQIADTINAYRATVAQAAMGAMTTAEFLEQVG